MRPASISLGVVLVLLLLGLLVALNTPSADARGLRNTPRVPKGATATVGTIGADLTPMVTAGAQTPTATFGVIGATLPPTTIRTIHDTATPSVTLGVIGNTFTPDIPTTPAQATETATIGVIGTPTLALRR